MDRRGAHPRRAEGALTRARRSALRWLPSGTALSEASWSARHRIILGLLWLHAVGVLAFGLVQGETLPHTLADAATVAVLAVGASARALSRGLRAALATAGLMVSSAVLVHLSGGMIEAHFHFFVMVVVISFYQSWVPFLLAVAVVAVHHGLAGAGVDAVFNHPAALASPWRWAAIHGIFLLAQCVACLVAWRANEDALDRVTSAQAGMAEANARLAEAQAIARIGSWDLDVATGAITWSSGMCLLAGVDPEHCTPTLAGMLELIHVDDRPKVTALAEHLPHLADEGELEYRFVRADGTTLVVHARVQPVRDADGHLTALVGTCQDITARKAAEAEMEHRALHDPLTGLGNRALFIDRVHHALAARARTAAPVTMLYLDLDDFKVVNDTLGHAAGDELLVEVSRRVSGAVRTADTVARLGGDEFAVLLEGADRDAAAAVADGILAALRVPLEIHGIELVVTASIGVATAGGPAPSTDLLRDADIAMYAAKRVGKDRCRRFSTGMESLPPLPVG